MDLISESKPTTNNLPGTETMKTEYTIDEVNSIATMFDTYHVEAHSWKIKTARARKWLKKHKQSIAIIIQFTINIALVWSRY